jgi:hypothetical protein
VLGSVAVGGFFMNISVRGVMLAFLCACTTTVLQGTFQALLTPWGVPTLTFPFCVGTLPFLLMQGALPSSEHFLPLAQLSTPEGNLRLVKRQQQQQQQRQQQLLMQEIHPNGTYADSHHEDDDADNDNDDQRSTKRQPKRSNIEDIV